MLMSEKLKGKSMPENEASLRARLLECGIYDAARNETAIKIIAGVGKDTNLTVEEIDNLAIQNFEDFISKITLSQLNKTINYELKDSGVTEMLPTILQALGGDVDITSLEELKERLKRLGIVEPNEVGVAISIIKDSIPKHDLAYLEIDSEEQKIARFFSDYAVNTYLSDFSYIVKAQNKQINLGLPSTSPTMYTAFLENMHKDLEKWQKLLNAYKGEEGYSNIQEALQDSIDEISEYL